MLTPRRNGVVTRARSRDDKPDLLLPRQFGELATERVARSRKPRQRHRGAHARISELLDGDDRLFGALHRLLRALALERLRECAHDGVERVVGGARTRARSPVSLATPATTLGYLLPASTKQVVPERIISIWQARVAIAASSADSAAS